MSEHKQEYTYETLLELFKIFDGRDIDNALLWWRTDGKYAPVTIIINCNDAFFWGCSDCESVGPEDLNDLRKAAADCKEASKSASDGALLWICRKREMRPQGAMYKYLDKETRPLFDACGPEREVGLGNPESNIVEE